MSFELGNEGDPSPYPLPEFGEGASVQTLASVACLGKVRPFLVPGFFFLIPLLTTRDAGTHNPCSLSLAARSSSLAGWFGETAPWWARGCRLPAPP
jgi:hypothetical protein